MAGNDSPLQALAGNRNLLFAAVAAAALMLSAASSRPSPPTELTLASSHRINYLGPTGGLLTAGEQCAFAVEHCAH